MSADNHHLPVLQGCAHKAVERHPCPYAEDIYGDDTPCTCCEGCQRECADDI